MKTIILSILAITSFNMNLSQADDFLYTTLTCKDTRGIIDAGYQILIRSENGMNINPIAKVSQLTIAGTREIATYPVTEKYIGTKSIYTGPGFKLEVILGTTVPTDHYLATASFKKSGRKIEMNMTCQQNAIPFAIK